MPMQPVDRSWRCSCCAACRQTTSPPVRWGATGPSRARCHLCHRIPTKQTFSISGRRPLIKGMPTPATIDLSGKAALVTGAASGIGRAIAEDLAAHGACVLLADLNVDAASSVAKSLSGALSQRGDVTSREDCRALVDRAVHEWGALDILVNNAGVQHVAPVEEFPEDRWEQLIRIMLIAPFLL